MQFGGLAATSFTYDPRGRLATITQGSGAGSRTTTCRLRRKRFPANASPTPPAELWCSLATPTVASRNCTFPDGAQSQFVYDANGNLTTVTPPGRPDHRFAFTQNNQVSAYTAPLVGAENNQTLATYDKDRQPTVIDRPDGQSALFQYDADGRLILLKTMAGDVQLRSRYLRPARHTQSRPGRQPQLYV